MDYKDAINKISEIVGFGKKSLETEEVVETETKLEVEEVVETETIDNEEDVDVVEDETGDEGSDEENLVNMVVTIDGVELYYDGELEVETYLFTNSGLTEAVEDGEYVTEDGIVLMVVSGQVSEIGSVLEQSENLKQIIKDNEIDNKDLTDQIKELTKELEKFKKIEIELRKTINDTPAVESLKYSDNTVEMSKDEIVRQNRVKFRQNLKK